MPTHHELVRAAMKKIGYQFPTIPEAQLMKEVLRQCLTDLDSDNRSERDSAIKYLREDLTCCEVCGVDPDWVRSVLAKIGLI
jgi:hypothetical protein